MAAGIEVKAAALGDLITRMENNSEPNGVARKLAAPSHESPSKAATISCELTVPPKLDRWVLVIWRGQLGRFTNAEYGFGFATTPKAPNNSPQRCSEMPKISTRDLRLWLGNSLVPFAGATQFNVLRKQLAALRGQLPEPLCDLRLRLRDEAERTGQKREQAGMYRLLSKLMHVTAMSALLPDEQLAELIIPR
jgi:hypothetical protein